MKPLLILLWIAALTTTLLQAQEWTRFRGPNGTGISPARSLPAKLTEDSLHWRVPLPGSGHSSPVVWAEKIFLTTAEPDENRFAVLCLDAGTGRTIWQQAFPHTKYSQHRFNSFASGTPVVDGERVYVSWVMPARLMVAALDHDGNSLWERDLGPYRSQHGGGASPMLHEGLLVLGNEQKGKSFIIALESETGKTVWQTPRESAAAAYATPCLYEPRTGKAALVFTSEAHGIYGLDPGTGNPLWEFKDAFDKRSVSSPVIAGDIIIGTCGSGGGGNFITAIHPGDGLSRKPELAYHLRQSAPYVPTSVAVGDLVWLWSDGGILTCLHAPTGEVRYQERVGGNYFGSPVWAHDRLYAVSTSGEVVVAKASSQFEVLSRFPLEDTCHTTPAISGERMFIRTEHSLVSLGGAKSQ